MERRDRHSQCEGERQHVVIPSRKTRIILGRRQYEVRTRVLGKSASIFRADHMDR